jgi:hypothetical protein
MKNPVVSLLQFLAWLMLFGVIAATWAGVTYPSDRAKISSAFSKIHPMCIHRVLLDERYEGSANLEYSKYPIVVKTIKTDLGQQELIQVTSTRKADDGGIWVVGYSMPTKDKEQKGPFLINMFHRSPDEVELGSLAGISLDPDSNKLAAHFFEGGNDRCRGGYVEVMGMAGRREIALSQASTLYSLLNPIGQLLKREERATQTTFPDWKADNPISNAPNECVGRLIGVFDHASETTSVTAVAVDFDALLRQSRNSTEACVADSIVRAKNQGSISNGRFTVYGLDHWNNVLNYVHQRCGFDQAFNPINSGI